MKFKKATGRKHHRKARRNPVKHHTKRRRARHNPAPSHVATRHRRRRHARRNPAGIDFKEFGIKVAVAGGGALAAVYINNLAAKWLPVKFRGIASIAAGAAAVMFGGRNAMVRDAAVGAAGMGLLDILRSNVPALVPLSAEDAGYLLGSASTYDDRLAAMLGMDTVPDIYGDDTVPNIFGVDTGSVPMGSDTGAFPMGDELSMFGVDTGSVPMGDGEGDGIFGDEDF